MAMTGQLATGHWAAANPAAPALASYVHGFTLVCGGLSSAPALPGTERIGIEPSAVSGRGDATVDRILALGGLAGAPDLVQTLRAWRRVLTEDGLLVVADADSMTAASLASIVQAAGGFERAADADGALVFVRKRITEIRAPFATLGPTMVAAAQSSAGCRAELLFQAGTLFVQCGEAAIARACFEQVVRREPGSAEGHFGLGMAYGVEQRWKEALCELECARRLSSDNAELERWLDLARKQVQAEVTARVPLTQPQVTLPSSPPAKWSPSPAPSPSARGCLRL
jgi:hypothetical protein